VATTTTRQPAVAGKFYPRNPDELLAEIKSYTSGEGGKISAFGCVVPHAGYMYSGHVAGAVYTGLELPRKFIILCPNHTGLGTPLSIMSDGEWETPLGSVPVDIELAAELKSKCALLVEDAAAHRYEHAIEVQLPFLQARLDHFSFVPVAIGTGHFEHLKELGTAIAQTLANGKARVLIIASSDMNHYESDDLTRMKDSRAIERILALDPFGLYQVVTNEDISMCGYGAATSMLVAARNLGAQSAELIRYATSGDISGDRKMVVGYAGVVVL
jgi:hypothetical protein